MAGLVGLRMDRVLLAARVRERTRAMYRAGLVDETRRLLKLGPISRTARNAIGYREAEGVLTGRMTSEEAVEQTAARTRRLAKRQMTWFRNQAEVEWIDVRSDSTPAGLAQRVRRLWESSEPVLMRGV
jgi:tRNA dimethylallyltransferase